MRVQKTVTSFLALPSSSSGKKHCSDDGTVEVVVCHWGQWALHTVQKDIEIADISLVALTLIRQEYTA